MLGFLFNSASANANDYPQLYENHSSSNNYEITKLIDGPIDSLYSITSSGGFIAQSIHNLWKINAQGEVIDDLYSSDLYASGLILEKEGFIDWVFTGDKQLKPYGETIDANAYSEKELFDAFDQADAVEFVAYDKTNGKYIGLAYLYKQGQIRILNIATHNKSIDTTQSVRKNHNLRREETKVNAGEFRNYQQKNPPFGFLNSINQESTGIIKSVGFKKIANHYAYSRVDTFLENNLGRLFGRSSRRDYSYPVGYTQYQLSHQNEQLKFSVFSDKEFDSVHAWNFSLLEPKVKTASDLKFITINYRRHYLSELNEKSLLPYYEQDVGLYVVRTKIPHNQSNSPQWRLSYSGLHAYDYIWGHIQFSQKELGPVYYWFRQNRPIPAAADLDHYGRSTNIASPVLKTLPESVDFHWKDVKRDRNFRLVINNQDAEFYKPDHSQIALTLYFDPIELKQAFEQLKGTNDTILLDMDMQERDFGGELVISLKSQNKKIVLKNTGFDYQEIAYAPKSPQIKPGKIQTELFLAYEESLFQFNPDKFLDKVNQLKQQNAIADYAAPLGYYFANLSLMLNAKGRFPENNRLFTQYFLLHQDITRNQINDQQQKNLMVLGSQGIYLGLNSMNPDLSKKVMATIIEQNFTLEQETNRAFLFNLACYYAVNHNKAQMLKVINRTMELGRDPESYLKDRDFTDYWQDPDFLNAIKKIP